MSAKLALRVMAPSNGRLNNAMKLAPAVPVCPTISLAARHPRPDTFPGAHMKRDLIDQDHTMFRTNFRQFCEREVVPSCERWAKPGSVYRENRKKSGGSG